MWRTSARWLGAAVLLVGCRSTEVAATDAAVDHRATAEPITIAPNEERGAPPLAIGGGPSEDEYLYAPSSALNVLGSARCHHARTCGIGPAVDDATNCEAEAARQHGSELAQCDRGVRGPALSDCAEQIREASCESSVAIPETCTAAVLCSSE